MTASLITIYLSSATTNLINTFNLPTHKTIKQSKPIREDTRSVRLKAHECCIKLTVLYICFTHNISQLIPMLKGFELFY